MRMMRMERAHFDSKESVIDVKKFGFLDFLWPETETENGDAASSLTQVSRSQDMVCAV